MKIYRMCKGNLLNWILLYCLVVGVLFLLNPGCESLPTQVKDPDNPLDPKNPNNTINGPALILSPTKVNVSSGSQFIIELWIVESDSIAALSTQILYDPVKLSVVSVDSLVTDSKSFFLQNGGNLLWFSTINHDSGFIQIDCAVVEGNPKDIEGLGVISRIVFQHVTGTEATISIASNSQLRNSKNTTKPINDIVGTAVTIR